MQKAKTENLCVILKFTHNVIYWANIIAMYNKYQIHTQVGTTIFVKIN